MKTLFFILSMIVCIYGCDDSNSSNNNNRIIPIEPSMNISVYAENGDYIGKATSVLPEMVTLINDNGFMFSLYYDGSIVLTPMYFEADGWDWESGGVYIGFDCPTVPYYKTVYVSHTISIAIYKVELDNGVPIQDTAVHYESSSYYKGYSSASGYLDFAVKITNAGWTEVGLRNDFGNITLEFE